ncbi:MAG: HesA/MoeB/ThiF family protein [Desulfurococcales archaeon]|nr:HesA/MoeB/ThiF family protein [Desulfurococcales archaeon]
MEKDCSVKSRRYSRQLSLLGVEGQNRLDSSRVAVVGLGGLGSIVSQYLVAAGVGHVKIIDGDVVEPSNLNRQVLYDEESIGLPKAYVAAWKLRSLNSCTRVEPVYAWVREDNVESIIGDVDLIVDCLDNWETRLILSRYARSRRIPLIHGAVESYYGQLYFYIPGESACLECIAPRASRKGGVSVIGPSVGVVASLEASLAILYLAGREVATNELVIIDSRSLSIDKIKIDNKSCRCS